MNRLRDVPLTRVRTARKLLQEGVGGHRLVERTHRNHHVRFHEAGKIAFVDPRMMIFVASFAQEVVVVALDRIDPLRSLDHGEVRLPRDARDFREHLAPVCNQVKHVVRRGDVEGAWGERKVRAFREDDVSKSLREAKFDHGSRDVDSDHADPALLERNRIPARPDADLEDPLAVELVHDVVGVQAQVTVMARIALWARLRDLAVDDVERALEQKRTIVKTWSMRGALHLLASNELLLYLRGLMPTRLPREQRWIQRAGLKEEEATAMILDALKNGPLTRAQLVGYLAKRLGTKTKDWMDGGWGHKTEGSNTAWQLVRPAVIRGLVCFGPSRGPQITFTRVDEWLREPPPMPAEDKAEDALVRHHLSAFGPADV